MPSLKELTTVTLVSLSVSACANGAIDKLTASSSPASKPYQATYSSPGNFAYQTMRIYRDGAGHVRMDISGQGPTVVNILDQNKNETTMWTEGVTSYVRRTAQPMDPLVMRVNMESMPKDSKTADALGAKDVSGHKCHGWRASGTEIWFDDDYGCPVIATSGGQTTTLTQFTPQAPDSSVFQPPAGYTETSTSGGKHSFHRMNRLRDSALRMH
jgi:hypothetical protein